MAAGSAQLVDDDASHDARSHYRPQLDGLRAFAVYLVVAFHSGLARFDGGFIGVDIFFVLSGYLVTQLLLRDIHGQGRIGFSRFYSRRFRRLLPASFLVLLVTAAVFTAVAAPAEVVEALRSIKAAFLYVANWFFIRESNDYFGGDVNASPVVHFWSLSIEEQFYAVWPLLLGGLVLLTRRAGRAQWHTIRVVVLIAAACSLIAALRLADTNFNRAYYGTDTRAYQLLAGAFLALTPQLFELAGRHRHPMRWVAGLALLTLVGLGTSLVDVGAITRGAIVTIVTCALIVALETARGGIVQRGLSWSPLVYLGQVSYGTYLWHWPVIVIALLLVDISPGPLFFLAAGLATGLASLSYQVLERPVRLSKPLDRYRIPVVACGLALSIVGAFVLAPAIVDDEQSPGAVIGDTDAASTSAGLTASAVDWEDARGDYDAGPPCIDKPVATCTIVTGGKPHFLLLGDSNAGMVVPTFVALAKDANATLSVATHDACPWQDELYYVNLRRRGECGKLHRDVYDRLLPKLDPDVVLVMNRPFDDPSQTITLESPDGVVQAGTPQFLPAVQRATEQSVEQLRDAGRKVIFIEPTPYASKAEDPLVCLSRARLVDECRYVVPAGPMGIERIYRGIADRDDAIWSLDIDRLVCPYLPICDPVVDGKVVKFDRGHLTATYARSFSGDIDRYFRDNSILDP